MGNTQAWMKLRELLPPPEATPSRPMSVLLAPCQPATSRTSLARLPPPRPPQPSQGQEEKRRDALSPVDRNLLSAWTNAGRLGEWMWQNPGRLVCMCRAFLFSRHPGMVHSSEFDPKRNSISK